MKKLLIVLLVLGLAAPAMAADTRIYGSARVYLGWASVDKDFAPGFAMPSLDNSIRPWTGTSGAQDDSGVFLAQSDGQARFGAYVVASDSLVGHYEVGYNASNMKTRLLYGKWTFGPGALTVGQDYTPATFLLYSNMTGDTGFGGDEIMLTTAIPYISRRPQIKLTMGGFQAALIERNTSAAAYQAFTPPYTADLDFTLPRIELAYQLNTPVVSLRPIFGFQTYDVVNAADDSKSITSYLAGLGAKFRFGPGYVNASFGYSLNAANYGLLISPLQNAVKTATVNATGDIEDATTMQGLLVAGFNVNPELGFEAGFGYMSGENKPGGVKVEQTAMLYYIQAKVGLAKGVSITPEVGLVDCGDLKSDGSPDTSLGSYSYVVAKFQIDF